MALTWGTLKGQLRRLLKDEDPARFRWNEYQLLDFVSWALDALCSHTAVASATGFDLSTESSPFTLPDNVYESIVRSGAVYTDSGIVKTYINPIRFNRQAGIPKGYLLTENDSKLTLKNITNTTDLLVVQYFAYYPHPSQESDLILAPSWATAALNYRMAAYAYSPFAGRRANIGQWDQKPDTGRKVDNPLQDQTMSYLEMWDQELSLYPPQQRENYFTR